jgi:hypothetical protein
MARTPSIISPTIRASSIGPSCCFDFCRRVDGPSSVEAARRCSLRKSRKSSDTDECTYYVPGCGDLSGLIGVERGEIGAIGDVA